jgi:hypothetical protein
LLSIPSAGIACNRTRKPNPITPARPTLPARTRRGNVKAIELVGDPARAVAHRVPVEDVADCLCLRQLNLAPYGHKNRPTESVPSLGVLYGHVTVSVRTAARVVAGAGLSLQAAVSLFREVTQIDLVHQVLDGAVNFAGLRIGVVAIRDTDDAHAPMFQAAKRRFRLDLITGQARNVIDQKHLELTCFGIGQHRLITGPVCTRTAYRLILVRLAELPALTLSNSAAVARLILDGRFPLLVGGIAGVQGRADHGLGITLWRPNPAIRARALD